MSCSVLHIALFEKKKKERKRSDQGRNWKPDQNTTTKKYIFYRPQINRHAIYCSLSFFINNEILIISLKYDLKSYNSSLCLWCLYLLSLKMCLETGRNIHKANRLSRHHRNTWPRELDSIFFFSKQGCLNYLLEQQQSLLFYFMQ